MDILTLDATRLARMIATRAVPAAEVMAATLARIDAVQQGFNAFTVVFADQAMAAARAADAALARGQGGGPLFGVPVTIKDFTPTEGQLTTRGSKVFAHSLGASDPALVRRLKAAGAIVVAKTTTPEFAYSSFTHSPLWGITRNPWDRERTPGGSSGGAAVSVVTGCVPLAEGSDMGGSVRIPAALSGCVGLKPSKGRIPIEITDNVFDHISHLGPLSRSVADAALFLSVTEGPDEADIQSQLCPTPIPATLPTDCRGLRLAISPDLGFYNVDQVILDNLRRSADALRDAGAVVEWVDLDWPASYATDWGLYWGVFLAAQYGHLLRDHRHDMDPDLVAIIEAGLRQDAVTIERGALGRTRQWRDMARLFETHDALLCPTMARVAPPVTGRDAEYEARDAAGRLNGLEMTAIFNNVSACPAIAVPNWQRADGLPTSIQIVGRRFDDPTVLRIAASLEARQPWPQWVP